MIKNVKAAIFDLDGTLLDTIYDLAASMNWGLEKYGFPTLPLEHHKHAVGNGLRKYAQRSIPEEKITTALLDRFVKEVGEHYRDNCAVATVVFDGIPALLDYLQEQGISAHILSNKVDAFVQKLVSHYFGDGVFRCVYGERENIPKKPDPLAALSIAEEIGIAPSEILFIGDSVYDVMTGNRAGMHAIAASWGYQSEERLLAEHPAFLAHSPYDIIEYLRAE